MKKTFVLPMAMIFAGMAASAYAANVTFTPGSVNLTVEPGKASVANFQVKAESGAPMMHLSLQVGSKVASGNLPAAWLKPSTFNIVSGFGQLGTSAVNLEVDVPANTAAGKYSAVLEPELLSGSEGVVSDGVNIVVDVPSLNSCGDGPMLSNVQVGPTNIWAPTEKDVEVNVKGNVSTTPGCNVTGTYSMASNTGNVSGNFDIDDAGGFTINIPIKVAKDANAKEGTVYNGTLSVVDEEGKGVSQTFSVQVDHDRGK